MKKNSAIVVIGSVAIDSIESPFGKRESVLGGSATYFSLSARFFNKVHIVAAVGRDFPNEYLRLLKNSGVGTGGMIVGAGKTFRWKGRYRDDLNIVDTIYTRLNVFKDFKPVIPEALKDAQHIFLANIDPTLQEEVLSQARNPRFIACDTMNFWILNKRKALLKVLKKVDLLLLNDSEAKLLSEKANLAQAAEWIINRGPGAVVIKKGEHGVLFVSRTSCFLAPAYPLKALRDPTGAGDSFAGGVVGHLSKQLKIDAQAMRKAIIYGSVIGSYCVEDFSVSRLLRLSTNDIAARFKEFKRFTEF